MSSGENKSQRTQHAFLVAWGWFAEHIGLTGHFEGIALKQKRYQHTHQTKVIEFLVSILGGISFYRISVRQRTLWTKIRPLRKHGDNLDGRTTTGSAGP